MKVLIVEDEEKLAKLVEKRLLSDDFKVNIALDGLDGSYEAKTGAYDLVILDLMLPYKDGIQILKEMREEAVHTPVIILTAKDSIEDKLKGFETGANDYLAKPFHLEELVARINNLLKANNASETTLRFGDLVLDYNKKELINAETSESMIIARKEFQLIEYLMRNTDKISPKENVFNYIWGSGSDSTVNSLEAYISFLRRKLIAIDSETQIKAYRGLGYRLEYNQNEKS